MIRDNDLRDFFRGNDRWGSWRYETLDGEPMKDGEHRRSSDFIARNNLFTVIGDRCTVGPDEFVHLAIHVRRDCSVDYSDHEPRWRDKQRIKNEIVGSDAIAVEVMPRQDEIEATGDWYHIWVVPPDFSLPSLLPPRGKVDS